MKALNKRTGQLEKLYVKALDSMPVGTIVEFNGQASDIPSGWEEVEIEDITSKITKTSGVGTVYNINAYKKGDRCYLNATIDYYNGVIFNIDSSLTPKYSEIAIGNNYSTGETKVSTISISANTASISANIFGTANPYLAFHIEWEV